MAECEVGQTEVITPGLLAGGEDCVTFCWGHFRHQSLKSRRQTSQYCAR